ncbi:hypothetical protein [Salinispora vitiensis]|uniref:hypothetical protein n=1 Tax=Salinispora vitiensis TaxID=999544 RepID=UPI000363AC2F|nr:hypothetical protein [Salinispora vitiensis]
MPRTALAYSNLHANSSIAEPAGTPVNPGANNGHLIVDAVPERTVLRVSNSAGEAKDVTVKAGDYPPAMAAGQGDLVVTVADGATVLIGPFESGRFISSGGELHVDIQAAMTGEITAFQVPKAT